MSDSRRNGFPSAEAPQDSYLRESEQFLILNGAHTLGDAQLQHKLRLLLTSLAMQPASRRLLSQGLRRAAKPELKKRSLSRRGLASVAEQAPKVSRKIQKLIRIWLKGLKILKDPTEYDQISTLPNGLRVATEALPGPFSGIGVYIDAGSRYESEELSGVSHIVDRLAFKVSAACPSIWIAS